jgi:GNAT superfamily N-acetyltransferase
MEIFLKELNVKNEMLLAFPLIEERYKIDFQTFTETLDEMIKRNDYKILAAFDCNEVVGVCGYWFSRMFYCGRYLQASNLIVSKEKRRLGLGKQILSGLEEVARKNNCQKIALDSNSENRDSHPLYFSEGFYIRGFHFMKDVCEKI